MYDAERYGFRTRQDYAAARRAEFRAALQVARADPRCIELGVPDQETTLQIPSVVARLCDIVRRVQPHLILTHPYEGGHPDHDACALAVHLASERTQVVEFTSYHNHGGTIRTGDFLPGSDHVVTIELTPGEQARKRAILGCFRTQAETLALFGVAAERFRMAPAYDFTKPPHAGRLYYEQFEWGMTGQRFCTIAQEVLQTC
jgi:LmbE family N-acetylglucosaminyl deacetylase